MPITEDIMKNEFVGPLIRQMNKKARVEGRREGKSEGQLELLTRLIGPKFGKVPPRILKKLSGLKPAQLTAISLRILDAQRIEDLFA